MYKEKLIRGFKIIVILLLLLCISLVSFIHWKSDLIVRNVLSTIQNRLADSLTYETVHMDAFAHFPCVAVQLQQLRLGAKPLPLLNHGNVDVVIRLLPLFHGAVDIDRILVEDGDIHIAHIDGKWTYEVIKKSEKDAEGKAWKTLVNQMQVNHSRLFYSDPENKMEFGITFHQSVFKGKIDPDLLDITMAVEATMDTLHMDSYSLPATVDFNLDGQYVFDFKNSVQRFTDWSIKTGSLSVEGNGNIKRNENDEDIDITGTWSDVHPEEIRKWIPQKMISSLKDYSLIGESEGRFEIKGKSSKKESPTIQVNGELKNGGLQSYASNEEVKNVNLEFNYQSRDKNHQNKSSLKLHATKKATFGSDLEGDITIVDFEKPVYDISIAGSLPAMLINLLSGSTLQVESGELDVQQFSIRQFHPSDQSFQQILEKSEIQLHSKELKCTYLNNPIQWKDAKINSSTSHLQFEFDELTWSKANAKTLQGDLNLKGDVVEFDFQSNLCEGHVESKGSLSTALPRPVFQASWIVKDINIRKLLESFSN